MLYAKISLAVAFAPTLASAFVVPSHHATVPQMAHHRCPACKPAMNSPTSDEELLDEMRKVNERLEQQNAELAAEPVRINDDATRDPEPLVGAASSTRDSEPSVLPIEAQGSLLSAPEILFGSVKKVLQSMEPKEEEEEEPQPPQPVYDYEVDDEDSTTRRLLIPLVSAGAVGGWLGKNTLQIPGSEQVQEATRFTAVDIGAEEATNKYFPGHRSSQAMDRLVWSTLASRGYTPENTLLATSTCPDEVNSKSGEMVDLMKKRWGEAFTLGGLSGIPYVGGAGFQAYSHHVPDGGNMLVVFAPHVGVDFDGTVGKLKRPNQEGLSSACGAAVGAFKAIKAQAAADAAAGTIEPVSDYFDAQINFIVLKLKRRLEELGAAPDAIAYVTYQMYQIVREFMIDATAGPETGKTGVWQNANQLTILGGIQINRAKGGDRFMPLMFQTRTQAKGSTVDLYEETFGAPPDLSAALGGSVSKDDIFKYSLEDFSPDAKAARYGGAAKKEPAPVEILKPPEAVMVQEPEPAAAPASEIDELKAQVEIAELKQKLKSLTN